MAAQKTPVLVNFFHFFERCTPLIRKSNGEATKNRAELIELFHKLVYSTIEHTTAPPIKMLKCHSSGTSDAGHKHKT